MQQPLLFHGCSISEDAENVYSIYLQSTVFAKYISSNVGCVIVAYIGFCSRLNRKMTPFDANGTFLPSSDADSMSSN